MTDSDTWFHEQMVRIQAVPLQERARAEDAARSMRMGGAEADSGSRRAEMMLSSVALLALVGAFTVEAAHGPMRADQPFGLVAPAAAFRAASMPAVNGRAPAAPVQDRNTVVLSGAGKHR